MKKTILILMAILVLISVVIASYYIFSENKKWVEKYCERDSDCVPVFSHCDCDYTCENKREDPREDCTRVCFNEESIKIPPCTCVDNLCRVKS